MVTEEELRLTATDEELIEQAIDLMPRMGRAMFRSAASMFSHAGERGGPHHGPGRRKRGRGGPPWHRGLAPQSVPQLKIAMLLYRRGPAKVGDIAGWLGVSPPTASEQVDRMVEAGMAERRINPEDRREVLVELTPKSTEIAGYACDILRARIASMLERFTPEERPIVIRTFEAFAEVFEQGVDCPVEGRTEQGDI